MATRFPDAGEAHPVPSPRAQEAQREFSEYQQGEAHTSGLRQGVLLGALALALVLILGGIAAWQLGWLAPAREAAIDYSIPVDDPTGAKAKMSFDVAGVSPTGISVRVANLGADTARLSNPTLRYVIWDKAREELRLFVLNLRLKNAETSPDIVLNAGEDHLLNFDYPGLLDDSAVPDEKTEGELALITMRPPDKTRYLTKRSISQAELRAYIEGHLQK
jgi:hypothetical protein